MHPLILLLTLRLRAVPRNLFRAGSTKRLVMALLGLALIALWLLPGFISLFAARSRPPIDPDRFRLVAPFALLALAVLGLFSVKKGGVTFTPAEVDLLFPAPISRRALLLYKLATSAAGALFFGLLFSIWFGRFATISWPGAFAAAFLASIFIQLLTIGAALALLRLGAGARKRLPLIIGLAAGSLVLLIAAQAAPLIDLAEPLASLRAVADLPILNILLAPFRIFVAAFTATTHAELLTRLAAALAIDTALVLAILRLDADYLESAAAASEKAAARLQRARRGGGFTSAPPKHARGRIADLPYLAGAGPLIWFQLTRLRRYPTALALPLLLMLVPIALLWRANSTRGGGEEMLLIMLLPITIFLVTMLRFDFRADPDYLVSLKALPIHPFALTIGQLTVPVAVMTVVAAFILLAATLFGPVPNLAFYAGLAFTPVLCTLLLATDNLVFLLAPARAPAHGLDVQATGRQAVLSLAKLALIAVAALPTFLAAYLIHILTDSLPAAAIAAWLILATAALSLTYATSIAFSRLDVALDMPT